MDFQKILSPVSNQETLPEPQQIQSVMSLVFALREKESPHLSIVIIPFDLATGVVAPAALDEFVSAHYKSARRYALWGEAVQRWLPIPTAGDMQRMIISLASEKKSYYTCHIWVDMPEQWSLSAAVLTSIESFESAAEKAAERAKTWLPAIAQSLTGYLDLGINALTEFTQGLNCAAPATQDLISFSAPPPAQGVDESECSAANPAEKPGAAEFQRLISGEPISITRMFNSAQTVAPSPALPEGSDSFVELPSDSFVELPTDSVLFAPDLQSSHDGRLVEMLENLKRSVAQPSDEERLAYRTGKELSAAHQHNLKTFQNMGFTTTQLLEICTILQQLPEHTEFPVIFETVSAQLKI
jgi:hypothetical protein